MGAGLALNKLLLMRSRWRAQRRPPQSSLSPQGQPVFSQVLIAEKLEACVPVGSGVLQSKESLTGSGFRFGNDWRVFWHFAPWLSRAQDPWDDACPDPAPAGAS